MEIPLVITLGISGHRQPERLGDTVWLTREIQKNFNDIKTKFNEKNGLPVQFVIISPLADGADRIFTNAVWEVEPDARLIVPMPFEEEEYQNTFYDKESIDAFKSYLRHPNCLEHFVIEDAEPGNFFPVGKYVVDHADIIFFISDQTGTNVREMDGGTASVQHYAHFDIQKLNPDDGTRIPLPTKGICTIDTKHSNSRFTIAPQLPPRDTEKTEEKFFTNAYIGLLKKIRCDFKPSRTPEAFKEAIEECTSRHYDTPAIKFQKLFNLQSIFVVSGAFLVGLLVLFDWASGGNDFFLCLGPVQKFVNWDSLVVLGFLFIIVSVIIFNKKHYLQEWVNNRYLAERMRQAFDFLYAGIPFSTMLKIHKNDPAHMDLNKIWVSLFFFLYRQYHDKIKTTASAGELKDHLIQDGENSSRQGLLFHQFEWHKGKVFLKTRCQSRFNGIKNTFFLLTILISSIAAFSVLFNFETSLWANRFDIASSIVSLLLAAIATIGHIKEHGKIANQYRFICKQLADIYKRIYFLTGNREEIQLKNLRQLVVEGSEQLMRNTYYWMYTQQGKDPDWL